VGLVWDGKEDASEERNQAGFSSENSKHEKKGSCSRNYIKKDFYTGSFEKLAEYLQRSLVSLPGGERGGKLMGLNKDENKVGRKRNTKGYQRHGDLVNAQAVRTKTQRNGGISRCPARRKGESGPGKEGDTDWPSVYRISSRGGRQVLKTRRGSTAQQ